MWYETDRQAAGVLASAESSADTNSMWPVCVCVSAVCAVLPCAVPIVTHVHGQNSVFDWSDGYTEVS